MGELYRHLTWRERLRIETRLNDGWKPQRIADELGRHVSTIYREKSAASASSARPIS